MRKSHKTLYHYLQQVCLGCHDLVDHTLAVCTNCQIQLMQPSNPCIGCCQSQPAYYRAKVCPHCLQKPPVFNQLIATHLYTPPMSTWIIKMKASKQRALAYQLGKLFAETLPHTLALTSLPRCHLIPVPTHPTRLRQMGFHPTKIMTDILSQAYGIPVLDHLIYRTHYQSRQHTSHAARQTHVKGAFALGPIIPNLKSTQFVIVDDVATSLATVNAISRILRKAYPSHRIDVWCLTRTPHPSIKSIPPL